MNTAEKSGSAAGAGRFHAAHERRRHLITANNPRRGLDYLVCLDGRLSLDLFDRPVSLHLRFVPDDRILAPAEFAAYINALPRLANVGLEDLAQTVLGDVNSELVPRWAAVVARGAAAGIVQCVVIEDRQPRWDNPTVLARLPLR